MTSRPGATLLGMAGVLLLAGCGGGAPATVLPTLPATTTVDRTAVVLDGVRAVNGRSDSVDVRGAAKDGPAVTTARQVTCGDLNLDTDGVRQPG